MHYEELAIGAGAPASASWRSSLVTKSSSPLSSRSTKLCCSWSAFTPVHKRKSSSRKRDKSSSIRDRVVQGALKLILEPIFEADFQPGSYGYRPKRTAHQALERVAQAIWRRKTRV